MSDGGDPACWLEMVCPYCGRLDERWRPGAVCPACGAPAEELGEASLPGEAERAGG